MQSSRSTASIIKAIAFMMETVRTSETSVYFYKTTRRHIPESSHLHTRRRENLIPISPWHILSYCCHYTSFCYRFWSDSLLSPPLFTLPPPGGGQKPAQNNGTVASPFYVLWQVRTSVQTVMQLWRCLVYEGNSFAVVCSGLFACHEGLTSQMTYVSGCRL
jgi:hypothetical protein